MKTQMQFWTRIALTILLLRFAILPALVPAATPEDKRSCLWKVSSPRNTVYLLGSVHLLKENAYPLSPVIEKAFTDAEKLVFEVNLDELNTPETQQLTLASGLFQGDATLKTSLSKETFNLTKARAEEMGLGIERLIKLRPWLVAITLAVGKLQELGFQYNHGIDNYLFEKARKEKKQVASLETAEYQIERLAGMSGETQEAFLLQTLKDMDVMETDFEDIVRAWADGDVKQLEKYLLESFKAYPQAYDRLLTERNRNWLPAVEGFLREEVSCLVVVGAAHLIGADGLVELLKGKGYEVQQL